MHDSHTQRQQGLWRWERLCGRVIIQKQASVFTVEELVGFIFLLQNKMHLFKQVQKRFRLLTQTLI